MFPEVVDIFRHTKKGHRYIEFTLTITDFWLKIKQEESKFVLFFDCARDGVCG